MLIVKKHYTLWTAQITTKILSMKSSMNLERNILAKEIKDTINISLRSITISVVLCMQLQQIMLRSSKNCFAMSITCVLMPRMSLKLQLVSQHFNQRRLIINSYQLLNHKTNHNLKIKFSHNLMINRVKMTMLRMKLRTRKFRMSTTS